MLPAVVKLEPLFTVPVTVAALMLDKSPRSLPRLSCPVYSTTDTLVACLFTALMLVKSRVIRNTFMGASTVPASPAPSEPAYLNAISIGLVTNASSPPSWAQGGDGVNDGGDVLHVRSPFGPPTAPMAM